MKTIQGLTNLTVNIAEPLYRAHIGPLTLPADCEALTTQLAAQGVKTFAIPQR